MASTIGELVVKISGDNTDLTQALNQSSKDGAKFASTITSAFASVGAAAGVMALAVKGIEFNKAAEQAKVSFTVMTGSAEKATKTLKDLKDFADKTPLEFKDLRDATQTLIQFGIGADDAVDLIKDLGDVSGGNADKLKSLSLAFGQMSATGRLMGQDLNQMINAGFNPLLQISETTGESMASLKAKMEAGAISTQMVRDAFTSATSEGGRFYGMLELQAETLAGKQSTLNDAFESFLGKMTEGATGPLKMAATVLTQILNAMSALPGPILAGAGAFVAIGTAMVAAAGAAKMLGITLSASFGPASLIIAGITAVAVGLGTVIASIIDAKKQQEEFNGVMKGTVKLTNEQTLAVLENESLRINKERLDIMKMMAAELRTTGGVHTRAYKDMQKDLEMYTNRQGEISKKQQDVNKLVKESAAKEAEAAKIKIGAIDETKEAKKQQADFDELFAENQKRLEQEALDNFIAAEEMKLDKAIKNIDEMEAGSKAWHERLKKSKEDETKFIVAQLDSQSEAEKRTLDERKKNYKDTVDFISKQFGKLSPEMGDVAESIGEILKNVIDGVAVSAEDVVGVVESVVKAAFSIISEVSNLYYKDQLDNLDKQTQAELVAAGVAEETALQRAQREYDAVKNGNDQEVIAEKESALKKEIILAESDRKRSKIEYESKKASHDMMILQTISAGALAIVQGYAQLGPIGGTIAAIATGIVTGVQLGILAGNAPKPPQYAMGTSFHPGGAALVGEFGAEMVQLPRGTSVATAQETRNMINNSSTNNSPIFNFYSPQALDPSEMEKRFILSQREAAYMGVFA